MSLKKILKDALPRWFVNLVSKFLSAYRDYQYKNLSTQDVFRRIYSENEWGKTSNSDHKFYSGSGSHDPAIVDSYVDALARFMMRFETPLCAVDVGCGDFNVGSKVRYLFSEYIACDIVPELINFNRTYYEGLNVDFRILNLSEDELPKSDVIFLRQVLQHLSNEQIRKLIPKLKTNYRILILTEHLPISKNFRHNIDKPSGPGIRSQLGGGVVLTSPPFNMHVISEEVLCIAKEFDAQIVTTAYHLSDNAPLVLH